MSLDSTINFGNVVAGSAAKPGAINVANIYARWTGYLVPTVSGKYTIGANSDDGVNIFLNDTPLLQVLASALTANGTTSYNNSAVIELTAGVFYPITVEWQHGTGTTYQVQLLWTPPGGSVAVIPSANLSTSKASVTGNLTGAWWNGTAGLWFPSGPGIIDFSNANSPNKNIANVAGTISDNLIKNGDFDQGLANWHLTDSTGTGAVVSATNLPRGINAFQADAVGSVLLRGNDFIPVDINKTYFMEAWIKIPAPGSIVLAGFTEYDGSQAQLTRSGAFAYCLTPSGITSTAGNDWVYFSAEITGNGASPTVSQFLTTAKSIRAMFLINWPGSTTNQAVQVLGVRFSEVAAGHTRAIKLLQKGVSTDLNKQGSILPNQVVLITLTMPSFDVANATWAAQSLLHPDNSSLSVPVSNSVLVTPLVTEDAESSTVGSQASGWTLSHGNGLLCANDFVHGGSKSLKIINSTAVDSHSFKTISGLVNGRIYSLRGWIKTTALPTVSSAGAMFHSSIGSGITALTLISTTSGTTFFSTSSDLGVGLPADNTVRDWTFVEMLFKPTGSGSISLFTQLGGVVGGCSGTAWFDDFGIYPTGAGWSGLAASTGYYLYSYIDALTGWILFANGNPPPTSPSDTLAIQCALDGRISLPVKHITTPASGGTGSDTGGGSGTCPEFDAPVFVRRYSQGGDLIFDGIIKAGEVQPGYESDDGMIKRGDFLKGYSFAKQTDVYRAVHHAAHVPCAGWMRIDGTRFTACETIWNDSFDGGRWLPAWKIWGAIQDSTVGLKVLIEVEADWDDEHNYYAGGRLIHNAPVVGC